VLAALNGSVVYGLSRCPQCGVATPLISKVGAATLHYESINDYDGHKWFFTGSCSRCKQHTLFYGETRKKITSGAEPGNLNILRTFPELEKVSDDLPTMARVFLQQAVESKHAPDGAVMLAASAIDAMLKEKGYVEGVLYGRIKKAADDHLLTAEMAAWAHEIRLSANEPRHADSEFAGAQKEDAEQIIAFAKALSLYLYELPARVKKWKSPATAD